MFHTTYKMKQLFTACILSLVFRFSAGKSLQCYKCPHVDDPSTCTHVSTCMDGEICISNITTRGGHAQYALGCGPDKECGEAQAVIVGRRSEPTTCRSCGTSLCNNVLHLKLQSTAASIASPTTPSPTTPSPTTPSPTTTSPTTAPPTTTSSSGTTTSALPLTTDMFSDLQLVVVPDVQSVEPGATVNFECNFNVSVGTPMNMTWWFKDLHSKSTDIYETSDADPPEVFIDVKDVSVSDSGEYICVAQLGTRVWRASGQLQVIDPSTITTTPLPEANITEYEFHIYPRHQTVTMKETAFMLCQFEPELPVETDMTWIFTNTTGQSKQVFSEGDPGSSMTFYVKDLKYSDAGLYTCYSSLGNTTWSANGTLTITG